MTGRTLGLLLILALLVAPLTAEARPPPPRPRIGILVGAVPTVNPEVLAAFRQGLHELRWREGDNCFLAYRWAEGGRPPACPRHGDGLAPCRCPRRPRGGSRGSRGPSATRTIPIVMAVSTDPVEIGFISSLARPGGNITGISSLTPEVAGHRLEFLKALLPQASQVAVLWNPAYPGKVLEWRATQAAADALGVTLRSVEVQRAPDFARAFTTLIEARPDALITAGRAVDDCAPPRDCGLFAHPQAADDLRPEGIRGSGPPPDPRP